MKQNQLYFDFSERRGRFESDNLINYSAGPIDFRISS